MGVWSPMNYQENFSYGEAAGSSEAVSASGSGAASAASGYALGGLALFQIASGLQQAEMIRRQADLTERINEMNAKYAELDAYEAEKAGYSEEARYDSQIQQTVSSQKAAFASKGVDVNFGSAAQVQADTQVTGMLNKIDILNQARAKARGFKLEASNIRLGGSMNRTQSEINASATTATSIAEAARTGISAYSRK